MNITDWGELIVFVIITAINIGIAWNKISELSARIEALEGSNSRIKEKHQHIELSIVNVPSKDDIKDLSNKISGLERSLIKLETTLDFMAKQNATPPRFSQQHENP